MLAYNCLDGGRSPFTGHRWPLPAGGQPGPWLEAAGPLGLCVNGLHACTVAQLPPWIGSELWAVELDGHIIETPVALVASRARLIEPLAAWDQPARVAFGQDCAARSAQLAGPMGSPLVTFIAKMAGRGIVGEAAYWSAVLAGEAAAGRRSGPNYDQAFAAERARQADHLAVTLPSVS